MAQQERARPRSRSMLSFGSHKSNGENASGGKLDLTESSQEKQARRMTSKANPSTAMNEAQPATKAALDEVTLEPIRSMQHRDGQGNIITDPDYSNPTRPRMERPLDTIRSFEAAVDGSYRKRYSARNDQPDNAFAPSRRSSYFQAGSSRGGPQPRYQGEDGSYYGGRSPVTRPESYVDNYANTPAQYNQGRRVGPRNLSDPSLYGKNSNAANGANPVYPTNGYQQSYDTVTSATGSHGTDQWGNSTDPSSENSSIDKVHQLPKQDLAETYGFSGFGGAPQFQGPILEEHGQDAPAYGQPGYGKSQQYTQGNGYQGHFTPPPPPPHLVRKNGAPQPPMKMNGSSSRADMNGTSYPQRVDSGEKRKSWLKRRFSKN